MKRLLLFASASAIALSCRSRDDAATRTKEQTAAHVESKKKFDLEIDSSKLAEVSAKLEFTHASLELWSASIDAAINEKVSSRIRPFILDQGTAIPAEHLAASSQAVSFSLDKNDIVLTSKNIWQGRHLPIENRLERTYLSSEDLSSKLFQRCPTDYFSRNGRFASLMQAPWSKTKATFDVSQQDQQDVKLISATFRPDGISWKGTCAAAIGWSDLSQTKVIAELHFELKLTTNHSIFPEAKSDANYPVITERDIPSEVPGHGTRFFKGELTKEGDPKPLQRWNPYRQRIVIDDSKDKSGLDLTRSQYGQWIQEALKIGVADLRIKLPAFGKKIVLVSEQPLLEPDIAFSVTESTSIDDLAATLVIDSTKGEIKKSRIKLGEEALLYGRFKMLEEFTKLGLIDDAKTSYRDAVQLMILHELGHALGLRHNFAGYGMRGNWGNDLQSVMSFATMGLPPDFLTDKIEWKPHDIVSLKILYAELFSTNSQGIQSLITEVLQYPLSRDDSPIEHSSPEHFRRALDYLATTNHPKVAGFRSAEPEWQQRIKAIYKQAYDVDL